MHSILNTFSSANYNPFTLTGLFLELLGLMTGPSVVEGNSYSTQYVKRAMDYMKNNYGYNFLLQTTALQKLLIPVALKMLPLLAISLKK